MLQLSMSTSPGDTTEDPCWQDLYDDDCSMSSVYSASFVAGKWIKSMPCASGLDEVSAIVCGTLLLKTASPVLVILTLDIAALGL